MPDEKYSFELTPEEQKVQGEALAYSWATGFKEDPGLFSSDIEMARGSFGKQPLGFQETLSKQWNLGQLTTRSGNIWDKINKGGGQGVNKELDAEAMAIWADEKKLQQELSDDDVGFVLKNLSVLASMGPYMWEGMKNAARKATWYGAAGIGAGLLTGPGAPVAAPALGSAGFITGASLGFYENAAAVEGGNLYRDLVTMEVDGVKIPHEIASIIATTAGSLSGLIEVVQMGTLAKVPGISKLTSKIAAKAANKLAKKHALKKIALYAGYRHTVDTAAEITEELLQETTQILGQEFAIALMEEKDDPTSEISLKEWAKATGTVTTETDWGDVGKKLWDLTAEIAIPMALLNTPSSVAGLSGDLHQEYKKDPDLQAKVQKMKDTMSSEAGGIMLKEPTTPEAKNELYKSLLKDRSEILSAAKKTSVVKLLNEKGWKGMRIPRDVALSFRGYSVAEDRRPIMSDVILDAERVLTQKGLPQGSEWYRQSGLAPFVKNETPEEALKFFAILSLTSAQADSKGNMDKAIKVWQKYKAGLPLDQVVEGVFIISPNNDPSVKAIDLLGSKDPSDSFNIITDTLNREEGEVKLRNFSETLKNATVDPEALKEYSNVVVDFRMGQYFWGTDRVPVKYDRERAEERVKQVRDYLRDTDDAAFWTTDRVQASLWTWSKEDRIERGLDRESDNLNYEEVVKFRAARHYEIPISELTDELVEAYIHLNQITSHEGVQVFDHYIHRSAVGDIIEFNYLDPAEQGTGYAGREWKNQIEPGKDRPQIIHVYKALTETERNFWKRARARVLVNNADMIYDFSKDSLNLLPEFAKITSKTDSKIIGDLERKIVDAGFFGYGTGNVVVFFSPVKLYPLKGYSINVSTATTADQYADAVEREDTKALERLEELDEFIGNPDARSIHSQQRAMEIISDPTFDLLRLDESEGHYMDTSEVSMDGFAEVGDLKIFIGKVAQFLQEYNQDFGYVSKIFSSVDRPSEVLSVQAPSYVFTFPEKLLDIQRARVHELLINAGLPGYTYKYDDKSMTIDHIRYPGSLSANQFKGAMDKFVNSLAAEPTVKGAFSTGIPTPTYKHVWKKHFILEKKNYDNEIQKGIDRARHLGATVSEGYQQRGASEIPQHLRDREDLYYPERQARLPENQVQLNLGFSQVEGFSQIETQQVYSNYAEGMDQHGNVYVKDDPSASNSDRVLFVQVDYHTTTERGDADAYFDKLYNNRDGYDRGKDFWEIPRWVGVGAATFPKSDFYVIRDVNDAIEFFKDNEYKAVMFSAMDVNKNVIKEVAENYDGEIHIGGYIDKKFFKDNDNITWHQDFNAAAKVIGDATPQKKRKDIDFRHFKGTKVIPRLCMSKGCRHGCAFCIVPKEVSPESNKAIDEQVKGFGDLDYKLIYLDDKTFGQAKNFEYLVDINKRIKKTQPHFQGFIIQTTGTQMAKFTNKFLAASGIKYMELGVESYNNDILNTLHKPHRTKHIDAAVEKLRKNNISLIPNVMVGLSGKRDDGSIWSETKKTYANTMAFLNKNKDIISHINVYNLALYEGSELNSQLEAQEIDSDENSVARSYHEDPALHEKFYNDVINLGIEVLDSGAIKGREVPTLEDPETLEDVDVGDKLYLFEQGFEEVIVNAIKESGIEVIHNEETKIILGNKLTTYAKKAWEAIEKNFLGNEAGGWSNLYKSRVQQLRPAMRDPRTGEIHTSEQGEIHDITVERVGIDRKLLSDEDYGYVKSVGGDYMTREEAAVWAGRKEPELESVDLRTQQNEIEYEQFIGDEKVTDFFLQSGTERIVTEEADFKDQMRQTVRLAEQAVIQARGKATEKQRALGKERLSKAVAGAKEAREKLRDTAKKRKYLNETIAYFKDVQNKIDNPAKFGIPEEEAAPIRDLFTGVDFTKLSANKKLNLLGTMEHLKRNPNQELPDRVWEQLERLEKTAIRDMTIADIQAVEKLVKHYMHLARLKKKIRMKRKLADLERTIDTSLKEMKNLPDLSKEIIRSTKGLKDKARAGKDFMKNVFGLWSMHYDLLTEAIAGPTSIVHDILYRQVKEGIRNMKLYRTGIMKKFADAVGEFASNNNIKDMKSWFSDPMSQTTVTDKITGQETTVEFTRGEVMSLYRHSLSSDNKAAILKGGFGLRGSKYKNKVYLFKDEADLQAVLNTLTDTELEIAGKVTDQILDIQGGLIAKVFKAKNGFEMDREGSYWRKDVVALERGEVGEAEVNLLDKLKGQYTRVGVPKGFTKSRVGSKKAVNIGSFETELSKTIYDAAAYIGLEIPMSNASQLLYNRDFRKQFESRYSEAYWKALDKGLRDIVGEKDVYNELEDVALKYRAQLSKAVLGLNPWVVLKQVVSLPLYANYVKPKYLINAIVHGALPGTKTEELLKAYSPEYLERVEVGFSRDVAEVFQSTRQDRGLLGGKKKLSERFLGGIQYFDRLAVVPGMQGAAMQVLAEFEEGKLSEQVRIALQITDETIPSLSVADKMRLAYRYADYATERTQPMFTPEHRSTLSRGNAAVKMFTMFSSFTNQAHNLLVRSAQEGKRTGNWKPFATSLVVLLVVNPLAIMAIDGLRDKLYGRDDKDNPRKGFFFKWLKNVSGYLYFFRDFMQNVLTGYDTETPMTKWLNDIGETVGHGVQTVFNWEDPERRKKSAIKFADKAVETILIFIGVPYSTPKNIAKAVKKQIDESGNL